VKLFILILMVALQLVLPLSAGAADLGGVSLDGGRPQKNPLDTTRYLSSVGTVGLAETFTLTPLFGVGYFSRGREPRTGMDESLHSINAQAGGRFDLLDLLYFSATAKMPVYSYDVTDRRVASILSSQERTARHQYDLFHLPGDGLTWSGEFGLKLGPRVDLNLFYDQSWFNQAPAAATPGQSEEKFGTRFILHF
jgi:hypothetical protein